MRYIYILIPLIALSALAVFFTMSSSCEEFVFVNKDVACGVRDVVSKTGYIDTRVHLASLIEEAQAGGRLSHASIYFRDLERGPVFGVNELEPFAPASLFKLPLAFVFFNSAETQPEVLTHKIAYQGTSSVAEQRVRPARSAEVGSTYTIAELLEMMLTHSDNASYEILEQFLTTTPERVQLRFETFQEIGLIDPRDRTETTLTVRGYASLLRLLYNASFLSVEQSEKVLAWLARSDYTNGLVAGVPGGVSVAHKFGERVYPDGTKELHDCGIIYYPGNPYLLCVMTRGAEWTELESFITTVSRIVYQEFDGRRL